LLGRPAGMRHGVQDIPPPNVLELQLSLSVFDVA
jgi:hypothetical protein